MKKSLLISFLLSALISCKDKLSSEDIANIGIKTCQVQPAYIQQTGLNARSSGLSTSEKRIKGLVLVEYTQAGNTSSIARTWQHPSWNKFGWMGAIASDDKGNTFVAPAPVVNVLDNPIDKQNTIYRVDASSGEMKPYVNLPASVDSAHDNPYGLLGLYFDCSASVLYASSIAGSTAKNERGVIYAIRPESGEVIDRLEGFDAMGLCMAGITGEKRLFLGSSRRSEIYSVAVGASGTFSGKPRLEFSLDLLGPRGDDKARRLRLDKEGTLSVWGIEFNYNLTAAAEKQESIFRFRYDRGTGTWINVP